MQALLIVLLSGAHLADASAMAAPDSPAPIHPNYENAPNPQLIPDQLIPLKHTKWDFAVGSQQPSVFHHQITFGYAPESELSGVHYGQLRDPSSSQDIVWYHKKVVIPSDWSGGVLTLEGIDYTSDVYIDGKLLRRHAGGYAPFDIELNSVMHAGHPVNGGIEHEILIRAEDHRLDRTIAVGKQERKPNEGVIFYGNSTGAWKGASIRRVGDTYISNVKSQGHADGTFHSTVQVASPGGSGLSAGSQVELSIIDRRTGHTVGVARAPVQVGRAEISLQVPRPHLWEPDSPELYDVQVQLLKGNATVEQVRSYTGFSTFEQREGHLFLNGKPYYLRGVLNQMVFPKGGYTPDTPESNANDIREIREHGFDFQRVHNTTPSFRDIYDMENGVMARDPVTGTMKRMGIIWTLEMPSARDVRDPRARAQFLKEWGEIVDTYGNGHPGLAYYVPGNEDWGNLEDPDHWAPATDQEREQFQLSLLDKTLQHAPKGAMVSVEDGWRQMTGINGGKTTPGLNPSQLILSAHDYRGSGQELLDAYAQIPINAPIGTPMPKNGKELILNGYDFPGDHVALIMGEFGGKSFARPEARNVFGYGQVYRDLGAWQRDSLDQLRAMGSLPIVRGGYVYTQVRDAGNKPHRAPVPGEPGGELNGFLFADGTPKGDPSQWAAANLQNQRAWENRTREYFLATLGSIPDCIFRFIRGKKR